MICKSVRRALARAMRHSTLIAIASCMALVITARPVHAQTYTVIHNFTGGADGAEPTTGLTIDARGNLYGTANTGGHGSCSGPGGCGTVFKLTRIGSGWIFTPIYTFQGAPDGGGPYSRVSFGPNGTLYGTTVGGGISGCPGGCGTVYNLQPPPTACVTALCPWRETVLYRFQGGSDAFYPTGDIVFDAAGAIYGTTYIGGTAGPGTVWKLTPSGGSWAESIIHNFNGGGEGGNPYGGVVFDSNGNLYGASSAGGTTGYGALWELSPSGGDWSETTLYDFQGTSDGGAPTAGLIYVGIDLYGVTQVGPNHAGTAYELTPSGDGWSFNTISGLPPGSGPFSSLVADSTGNLYGATQGGSGDYGAVFKLTPSGSGWTLTVLHRFSGSDGNTPYGSLVIDPNGNLYGTTLMGGSYNKGVVFEITP